MFNSAQPILIVDDDPNDAAITRRSLIALQLRSKIDHVENGSEALAYLLSGNLPSIILLDMEMPEMDGIEFLKARRENPEWLGIPVIVLSSNSDLSKRKEALQLGACGYMIKPLNYPETTVLMKTIASYWSLK